MAGNLELQVPELLQETDKTELGLDHDGPEYRCSPDAPKPWCLTCPWLSLGEVVSCDVNSGHQVSERAAYRAGAAS
jgi:hypothetical protein